jgi:hypothetical protein
VVREEAGMIAPATYKQSCATNQTGDCASAAPLRTRADRG